MLKERLLDPDRNPVLKQILNSADIVTPPPIRRSRGSLQDDHLQGRTILIAGRGSIHTDMAPAIQTAGCVALLAPFVPMGPYEEVEHLALRSLSELGKDHDTPKLDGILFDATHFESLADLDQLYDLFHLAIGHLHDYAKIVIINRLATEQDNSQRRMLATAVEGFGKSLAKELGRRAACVNLVNLAEDEEAKRRIGPVIEFFLSDHAAFITKQLVTVSGLAKGTELPPLAGSLAGRTVMVTGAARGIGLAICQALASEGAHVIALDRAEEKEELEALASKLEGIAIARTLGTRDAAQLICDDIRQKHGYVDVVVHNAGITRDRSLRKMSRNEWDSVLNINLASVYELTLALIKEDLLRDGGRIICMSSISGLAGNFGQSNYACSKAGMSGLVQGLANDLAGRGITANAIAPGFIDTAMTRSMPVMAQQIAKRLSILSQSGIPQDVADAVCFLASPCSQGISGQVLRVCGGHIMGA